MAVNRANHTVKTQSRAMSELRFLSQKLGLNGNDVYDLIDVAMKDSRSRGNSGVPYTSIFRYKTTIDGADIAGTVLLHHRNDDDDAVPQEYLAIITGAHLFFSIE